MAVETLVAVGATAADVKLGHGMGGDIKGFSRTIEISASATNASTYDLGFIPVDAKILGISTYSIDDCSTESTATLDFGFASVDGNFTTDADAVNDGIVLGTAARDQPLVKGIDSYGKRVWQLISGATVATKGYAKLQASIQDAAISATGGTLTVEVFFLLK
jgi:hypothetical protein